MILVTGGAGYLGGRLCDYLIGLGIPVRSMLRSANDVDLPKGAVDCVYGDLLDEEFLRRAMRGVHTVVHLAGLSAFNCGRNASAAVDVNGLGTYKLLEEAHRSNVRKFIYMSTIHVYGTALTGYVDEDTLPRPLHNYGISKRLGEDFACKWMQAEGMEVLVYRLSNAVGPPLNAEVNCWDLVSNDWIRTAVSTGSIAVKGSMETKRDFVPISVVENVLRNELLNEYQRDGFGIINLASGSAITLSGLLESILNVLETNGLKNIEVAGLADKTASGNLEGLRISNQRLVARHPELNFELDAELDATVKACMNWFQ